MLAASLFIASLFVGSFAAPPLMKRETHVVDVGYKGNLVFNPPAIFANEGDLVQFRFNSKNHSVVQSSLAAPCSPLANGFRTDFMPVAADATEDKFPIVEYTVHTAKDVPVWFYCSQAIHTPNAHCAKGMVFSINCGDDGAPNSLDEFIKKAKADPAATAPVTDVPTPTDVIVPLVPEPTYSDIIVPAITPPVTKTDVITLGSESWTTTYASYPGSPDPTPSSAEGSEIQISVGADGALVFKPAYVEAKPRDTLVFNFESKNHSVVQSSFAAPCSPFFSAQGASGINSGFFPVTDGQPTAQFRVKVNDTTPLYFYCGQPGHCGKGMVFAVNTDEKGVRSSTAFQTLAKQINGTTDGSNTNGGGSTYPGDGAAAIGISASGIAFAGVIAAVATFLM